MTVKRMRHVTPEMSKNLRETSTREHNATFPKKLLDILAALEKKKWFNGISQLDHSLQTATRAAHAGLSEEMVVISLLHDSAKTIMVRNHAAIIAEILCPYISVDSYQILRTHETFQGFYYFGNHGLDPNAREVYANEVWYGRALEFSELDEISFDPDFTSIPLYEFEPLVQKFFSQIPARKEFASASAHREKKSA